MATVVQPRDRLLPQIAALRERDGVIQQRFLHQRALARVHPDGRGATADAQGLECTVWGKGDAARDREGRGVVRHHLDGARHLARHHKVTRALQCAGEVVGGHEHLGVLGPDHLCVLRHMVRADDLHAVRRGRRVEHQRECVVALAGHGH